MRVAGYVRVSTEEQAKEGFSLEAQKRRLCSYADAQGWTLGKIYCDEGKSGRNERRAAYQALMAERDSWDLLLVVKMDRIHRNSRNFMAMMEDFEKQGKKFASVTEAFDTSTAMGRFVMDIVQRIAQLESEVIGERVFVGMEEKAKSKGGSLGKPAPYGYRWSQGVLVIEPDEANVVRMLFAGARYERTFADIGRKLNVDRFQVRRMMTNPTYAGATVWKGIVQKDTHAALVSIERFRAIQTKFKTGVSV